MFLTRPTLKEIFFHILGETLTFYRVLLDRATHVQQEKIVNLLSRGVLVDIRPVVWHGTSFIVHDRVSTTPHNIHCQDNRVNLTLFEKIIFSHTIGLENQPHKIVFRHTRVLEASVGVVLAYLMCRKPLRYRRRVVVTFAGKN